MLRSIYKPVGLLVPAALLAGVVFLLSQRAATDALPIVQLTFDGPGVANHFPVASPDGRYLLFQRCDHPAVTRTPDGQTLYHFKEDESNWDIYRMRVDGTEVTRLTDSPAVEDEPAWSPDGGTIAYRFVDQARFTIWLMDADGSNKRPLVDDPNWHAKTPSFAPDGSKVIFYANRAARQSWNVFTIDLASREIKQLTTGPFEDKHPQFTPDARAILFHSDRQNLTIKTKTHHKLMRIFALDLATEVCTPLTDPKETRDDRHAFLSPDGRHIVYHSLRFGPDPQHMNQYKKVGEDIYIMTHDGRRQINVTQGERRYFKHPSWSADGKGIYCVFKDKRGSAGETSAREGAWNVGYLSVQAALEHLR